MTKIIFSLFLIVLLFSSCQGYKKVVLMQGMGEQVNLSATQTESLPDPLVKNGDLLSINVNTISLEASMPFNKMGISESGTNGGGNSMNMMNSRSSGSDGADMYSYLVDKNGEIDFPVLGKLKVAGMTRYELSEMIRKQIYPRFLKENPIVTVRFQGFSVIVMKELGSAVEVTTKKERINILEAIAKSGGLAINSRKDNVLIIRENQQGKREIFRINLMDKNLIYSPYYYLQQNDIVYIEPTKSALASSVISTNWGLALQIITPFLTLSSIVLMLVTK
jgi:Periplasmic protein involved in polysaccharide export